MVKRGRNRMKGNSKRATRRKEPPRARLDAEPWYAGAAKSIGITARDQARRVATVPNVLPP